MYKISIIVEPSGPVECFILAFLGVFFYFNFFCNEKLLPFST